MKLRSLALSAFALAALTTSSAFASTVDFSFNFAAAGFTGTGIFETQLVSGNEYLITGISGTVNGTAISGLLAPGSFPNGFLQTPNDNELFFPGNPGIGQPAYFDNPGVSFSVGTGRNEYDINLNDTLFTEFLVAGTGKPFSGNLTEFDAVEVAPSGPGNTSAVPEPGTLALMSTGFAGLAEAVRRRRKV